MVLTEWKKAREGGADAKFREAVEQAKNYADGPLAGNELHAYRYAVVVTEKQAVPLPNKIHDGVTYRHINIAVNPDAPSHTARATTTVTPQR